MKKNFRLKLAYENGEQITGKRIVLNIAGQTIDTVIAEDGLIEVELTGQVDLYLNDEDTTPTKEFCYSSWALRPY